MNNFVAKLKINNLELDQRAFGHLRNELLPFLKPWVTFMRSHKQTQDQLRRKRNGTFEYCCLGALAEVLGIRAHHKNLYKFPLAHGNTSITEVNLPSSPWIGTLAGNQVVIRLTDDVEIPFARLSSNESTSYEVTLTSLNDNDYSFEQIIEVLYFLAGEVYNVPVPL